MKRSFKLVSLFAVFSLFLSLLSCDNREKREYDENGEIILKGNLSIAKINFDINTDFNDEIGKAGSTDKVNIDNFIVRIVMTKTEEEIFRWVKSDMPKEISMRTGKYRMEVMYPEKPKDGEWSQPAYFGSRDFIIEDGKTANIGDIVCRASNVKVSVVYKPIFTEQMQSYKVTVTNSGGYKEFNETETRSAYFKPGDLLATVTGKRNDGNSFSQLIRIKNSNPGDHHIITVDAQMIGTGTVNIVIDTRTNDKVVDLIVIDDDVIVDPDPNPDPDPDPDPEFKLPTIAGVDFDIKQVMRHQQGKERVVDVKVTAEEGGIKKLNVVINSPTLEPLLGVAGIPKSFDLANLTPSLKKIFLELGLISDAPIKDQKEFTFSIGAFMTLMPIGQHKFEVSVTDGLGVITKETLTISVN